MGATAEAVELFTTRYFHSTQNLSNTTEEQNRKIPNSKETEIRKSKKKEENSQKTQAILLNKLLPNCH